MSLVLESAARATVGARSGQEDAFRLWPPDGAAPVKGASDGLLAVLADGMGGHAGGAVAGETACSMFAETFAAAATPYPERLKSSLQASNEALAKGVAQNAALRGMGCTLIAAWIDALGIRWTSVGDSLLLLYRFPDVIRLNADHSLGSYLDEQARQKRISQSEAKAAPNRNALRSALTGSKIDLIDLRGEPMELRAGDWIVLASDGICTLGGDELADVIYRYRQSTPEAMAEALIGAVVAKGTSDQDNTTVVAVRVGPDGPPVPIDQLPTRVVRRTAGMADTAAVEIPVADTNPAASVARTAAPRASQPPSLYDRALGVSPAVWLGAAAGVLLVAVLLAVLFALQLLPGAAPSATRAPAIRVIPREPAGTPPPSPPTQGRAQDGYVPPFDQPTSPSERASPDAPGQGRAPGESPSMQQAPTAPETPQAPSPRTQKSLSQPYLSNPQ